MKSAFFAAGLVAAGLALPASAAEQQAMPASTIVVSAKYQKNWDKGSKLEADGLKELEQAKRDLVRSSADVVEAQNKRTSSDARAANSAEEFRRLTAAPINFVDASEAARWAREVDKAAAGWAKYDKRGDSGSKSFEKAVKQQRKDQEAVSKAQAKVDRGRTLKAEAERLSMMQARGR